MYFQYKKAAILNKPVQGDQSYYSKLVSTRRPVVLILSLQLGLLDKSILQAFLEWPFLSPVVTCHHRHLSNIDCLTMRTACLVCFISTINGLSKNKRKKPIKSGTRSGHITNLKQSIFETFDIYACHKHHVQLNFLCLYP
jgi:hypothetical protein